MLRIVVALVLVVGLAGCGGGEEPSIESTPSLSASASPPEVAESGSTESPEPPENSLLGATGFVQQYIELINEAQRTGDTERLSEVEAPGCRSCSAGREFIADLYDRGGRILGGKITATLTRSMINAGSASWTVQMNLTISRQKIVRPWRIPTTESVRANQVEATFHVERSASGWLVANWTRA